MNLMIEWVTQIVIFIIIGTILELILPNNKLKQYIEIVIGLLLLIILAKPLLFLFQTDFKFAFEKIDTAIIKEEQVVKSSEMKLEKQKREIEREQAAYILEETKKNMIETANKQLKEVFALQAVDLTFHLQEQLTEEGMTVEKVTVHVTRLDETKQEMVAPVIIDTTKRRKTTEKEEKELNERIKALLSQIWEMDEKIIELKWEGDAVD